MDPLLVDHDIRVDIFTGDGCAVRLTHIPTGLTVTASNPNPQASQIQLKARAAAELREFLSR
jgi:protein subunit release factor A